MKLLPSYRTLILNFIYCVLKKEIMNFSYEEIFSMHGQYDNNFVTLNFHIGSEAYIQFKPTLMGSFIYTLDERKDLHEIIKQEMVPRTNQYIKFKPSVLENLSEDTLVALDKKGLKNGDIDLIYVSDMPRSNRFLLVEKEIENVMKIKFDASDIDLDKVQLGFLSARLKNGYSLSPNEKNQYLGLQIYFNKNFNIGKDKINIIDSVSGNIKDDIKYYYLKVKFLNSETNKEEVTELENLIKKRAKANVSLLLAELNRASEKLKETVTSNPTTFQSLVKLCTNFESDLLLPHKIPIWWDFERFLHIYLRHVKEIKMGKRFEDKTVFQYKLEDVKFIIKAVIQIVYKEMEEFFTSNPNKNLLEWVKEVLPMMEIIIE